VANDEFEQGFDRVVAGLEKTARVMPEEVKQRVAWHEVGHALVACTLPHVDPVHKVSIIPRGVGALGYTLQRPIEDRFLMTQEELENKMAVLLGGRAAERLVFGRVSTGAHDDQSKATHIARNMVMRYGMIPELGPVTYDGEPTNFLGLAGPPAREYSEATAARIDAAVADLLGKALRRAAATLQQNEGLLKEAAQVLLAKETLTESDLAPIFERIRRSAAAAAPAPAKPA
jgi:cell division protease FtsH